MAERILGFKEDGTPIIKVDVTALFAIKGEDKIYLVQGSKLVPVVSVKWLEKALRKYEKRTDLLLAAKKEAYGNRTVLGEAEKIIEKNLSALKRMARE